MTLKHRDNYIESRRELQDLNTFYGGKIGLLNDTCSMRINGLSVFVRKLPPKDKKKLEKSYRNVY